MQCIRPVCWLFSVLYSVQILKTGRCIIKNEVGNNQLRDKPVELRSGDNFGRNTLSTARKTVVNRLISIDAVSDARHITKPGKTTEPALKIPSAFQSP
jgi:hypothetical protein